MMRWDYANQESEFAAAVAASAFAIYSLEQAEAKYRTTDIRSRKEDTSVGITRQLTGKELKEAGEISIRKPSADALPSRKPSRSASTRPMASADQRVRGNSMRSNVAEDKVDSWEKAKLRKINKRYEKMKSDVLAWENAKKTEAKLRMERKKNELEMRKIRNMQHNQIKIDRIEAIAREAKGQIEGKRRNEESEVKERTKYMRSRGKNPVKCFCC